MRIRQGKHHNRGDTFSASCRNYRNDAYSLGLTHSTVDAVRQGIDVECTAVVHRAVLMPIKSEIERITYENKSK